MNLNFLLFLLFGHETDFTIADFVSDLRAPTPSAAAELAVPEISKVEEGIRNYQNRYRLALRKKIEFAKLRFEKCMQSRVYKEPLQEINDKYLLVDSFVKGISNDINKKLIMAKTDFSNSLSRLDALSPLKTLSRGYSITMKDNKAVKKAKDLKTGDKINIRFSDGEKIATVD